MKIFPLNALLIFLRYDEQKEKKKNNCEQANNHRRKFNGIGDNLQYPFNGGLNTRTINRVILNINDNMKPRA